MKKLLAASAIAVASPSTQALDPITAEDMLEVTTVNVLDFSEDGRKVAVGARRTYDNLSELVRRGLVRRSDIFFSIPYEDRRLIAAANSRHLVFRPMPSLRRCASAGSRR